MTELIFAVLLLNIVNPLLQIVYLEHMVRTVRLSVENVMTLNHVILYMEPVHQVLGVNQDTLVSCAKKVILVLWYIMLMLVEDLTKVFTTCSNRYQEFCTSHCLW